MPKGSWTSAKYEGLALHRIIKRLQKRALEADEKNDLDRLESISRTLGYLAICKSTISKSTELEQLKKEVAELKQTLTMARANTIPA